MKLEEYMKCEGCEYEIQECFWNQQNGYDAGLEFSGGHCSVFVIDPKTGNIIMW